MAESTLTLDYIELMAEVGYFLFGKRALEDLDSDQHNICDDAVQAGYRQFLYPPMEDGVDVGYEWTFLQPTTYLTTTDDDQDQDMPEDFGRLISSCFTYAENEQVPSVLADVGEGKIRSLRMALTETGRPRVAGLRRKATSADEAQIWEVMWYPTPDDTYTLYYKYEALIEALTEDAPYPLGGIKYADVIKASCIAAADDKVNDVKEGPAYRTFIKRLIAAIARDKREGQKFFGDVGPKGQYGSHEGDSGYRASNYTMTIGGTQIYPSS